ncbi:MAG: hypothetical protein AB7V36_11735 [Bacteroidales bacterium]
MRYLICITSCKRLSELKKFIFPYIKYCNSNLNSFFLLALDGMENEYLDFCNKYSIPLIYSHKREGVGISKNRVLKYFPEYDYYFFLDDDVELLDFSIFADFINVFERTQYHHMSANFLRKETNVSIIEKHMLTFGMYGGAYFNFFTKEGIEKVGGWHTHFSKYKRYGHTEHTYRFFHQGLCPAPFIALTSSNNKILLHNPPHVSEESSQMNNESQLIPDEEDMIAAKTTFFPVTTMSEITFNGYDMNFNKTVDEFLQTHKKHYPLTFGKERRISLAEYYFGMFLRNKCAFEKAKYFLLSLINNPCNIPFKHFLKTKLHLK